MFRLILAGVCCALFLAVVPAGKTDPGGPDDRRISLSQAEKRWAAGHPVVRFAADPSYKPIEALDAHGTLTGMSADYLALLERITGLQFEATKPRNWDDAMRMVREGEADILSAATKTDARQKYLTFASPHIELPGVIITRRGGAEHETLNNLRGKTVGIVSGYVWQEWVSADYPDIKILPVPNMDAGLLLTSFGQLDAMIGNLATATQSLRELGITNLIVTGSTGYAARLAIASRKDLPILASILEKGIAAISPDEHLAIFDKYISLDSTPHFGRRTVLLTIAIALGIALLIAGVTVAWNYSLRQMVRRQNAALRESGERYRAIVEDQSELISRTLPGTHIITFVNEAYCKHYGLERVELLGTSFLRFVLETDRDEVDRRISTLSREQPTIRLENRIVTADGAIRWFHWSNRAIFDDAGDIVEIQAVGQDITERKRIEDALMAAKDEAELASRTKSEFLANMSHELRTPLNAIIGFSEMISGEMLGPLKNPQYREYGKHILSSGNHLLSLISDVLDVTKIETGDADFVSEDIDLKEVVHTALVMISDRAAAGGIKVVQNLPATSALLFHGDRRRLIQILVNVLSNSIKFTGRGGTATLTIESDLEGGHVITVSDTGIGISPENISKVFERFGRISDRQTRGIEGIGLGLPLTKALVEMHGGSIKIESEPDVGTTVTLWFPLRPIAQSA
jgi:two-component system, sensor histidine kinase and response regulator